MTTGQRIRRARIDAGLTQKEFADKLGISYVGVSQWETDKRNPKFETLKRMADVLGTSPYHLAGWEYEPNSSEDILAVMESEIRKQEDSEAQTLLASELNALDTIMQGAGYHLEMNGGEYFLVTKSDKYTLNEAEIRSLLDNSGHYIAFLCEQIISRKKA